MTGIDAGAPLRVTPRVWRGVLALLLYLAVFYGVWIFNGIDYTHIGDSETTLWKWYVAPLAAGTVVLVAIVSIYGWWRPSRWSRSSTSCSATRARSRRRCGSC